MQLLNMQKTVVFSAEKACAKDENWHYGSFTSYACRFVCTSECAAVTWIECL